MNRSIPVLAWVLLGILTVAAIGISLGKRENLAEPRIDSYRPSGLSAFADLLRRSGYRVETSLSSYPALAQGDVVVACVDESQPDRFDEEASGIYKRLADFIQKGGRAIVLPFKTEFREGTQDARELPVERFGGSKTAKVNLRAGRYRRDRLAFMFPGNAPNAALWSQQGEQDYAVTWLTRDGTGTVLTVADGYIATNRFIDQVQNANVLIDSLATLAPKGSHVVFTEATYNGTESGLLEMLGPGASAAWYQSVFLFLVVVFTLGKRFGLPDETRPPQTGQRQLVDAVADSYRRAGATRVACRAAYDRSDMLVRNALKLSSDAPASERDERIPEALALEFRRVFDASIDAMPVQESFQRVRALKRQTDGFLHRRK